VYVDKRPGEAATSRTTAIGGNPMTKAVYTQVIVATIALTLALLSVSAKPAEAKPSEANEVSEEHTTCYTIDISEQAADPDDPVTSEAIDALIAQGYKGDPNDGAEMLYSPECWASGPLEQSVSEQGLYAWDADGDSVDPIAEDHLVEYVSSTDNPADAVSVEDHECFEVTSSGPRFLATDGCSEASDTQVSEHTPPSSLLSGDELENYNESIAKGCTEANMLEDYSCKGPQYKGYTPITQQGTPSFATSNWHERVTPVKPASAVKPAPKPAPAKIVVKVADMSVCYDTKAGEFQPTGGAAGCSEARY
jgi:hypothetical protein